MTNEEYKEQVLDLLTKIANNTSKHGSAEKLKEMLIPATLHSDAGEHELWSNGLVWSTKDQRCVHWSMHFDESLVKAIQAIKDME